MKDQAKSLVQQFKNTPTVVVAAALLLAIGAFGLGLAAGDSDDSDGSKDAAHHGFKHRGGQGYGGPGRGRMFNAPDPESLEKFRDCLKDAGVELPKPGSQPSKKNREKARSAIEKCHEVLPSFQGRGGGSPGGYGGPPGGDRGGPPGGAPGIPPGGGPDNY